MKKIETAQRSIVDEFINICRQKGEKPAFICKKKQVTYIELLKDMYRTINLIKDSGLTPGDKALVFLPPSYELYLLLLSGLCYGVNLLVPDCYNKPQKVREILNRNQVNYVFCNNLTTLLKPLIGFDKKFINVCRYTHYTDTPHTTRPDSDSIVLTTFTSGTTNEPKPIKRSLKDLSTQIEVVTNNIAVGSDDIAFSKLPIYTLFIIFKGLSCVIHKRLCKEELQKHKVTAILAPIAEILKIKDELPFISRVSVGGAIMYPREIEAFKNIFPKAEIGYVYGSSECVLIAKTSLHKFEKTFAFDCDISGIEVSVVNKDKNGVGQICVSGKVVLSDTKTEVLNDIGLIDEEGLHIVGRKNFSSVGNYNYLTDREILSKQPRIKKGFSLVRKENIYFCYEGKLSGKPEDNITYVRFRKLPMDYKHKTKLNYHKALKKINKLY